MNNKEFRQALVENDWLSPMRADRGYPVSIDEIQCQDCPPDAGTLIYEESDLSVRTACEGCGRADEISERTFSEHTWTKSDRDRFLSPVLHTPTLDSMADDDPFSDRP